MAHVHPFDRLFLRIASVIPFSESPVTPYTRFTPASANVSMNTSETFIALGFPGSNLVLHGYKMFTARAASKARVAREMVDWIIISTLAQRESTGESVGEKAVLVLNARNR